MQEGPHRKHNFKTALRSDDEVIKLYLDTREAAYFSLLYNRYAGKIFSKCISMLKDEGLAQDATQDIFVKIFANLAKFSGKSKFSTWIYSITYNYCIDFIRRKKKEKNLFTSEMDSPPDIIEDVDDSELLEIELEKLKFVLNEIPIGDKAILMMKYQEEMSIKEIADTLEKTESAIKMKIKRAKTKALSVYKAAFGKK
jgi:RNA polymerase sigma-70 factor, ECF subfamily